MAPMTSRPTGLSIVQSIVVAALAAIILAAYALMHSRPGPDHQSAIPRYRHIFVIIEENKDYRQLMGHPELAPVINQLASEYGLATNFYAETHPSEANYVATLGGDTFGIHDDYAFYCHAGPRSAACPNSEKPGYANHDIAARSLMDQLAEKGLSWKAYMESIPMSDPLAVAWPTPDHPVPGVPDNLYAAKHNGFVNFSSVNRAPASEIRSHFVDFKQLARDLANDTMPNYAHIVPNECNEMHGLSGQNVPPDCDGANLAGLIRRGDAEIGMLVGRITHSKVWTDPGNAAIVVTFDENNGTRYSLGTQGCCGSDRLSAANFGGGHIVTIVITNHGPRHVTDDTPYNHYSLLRTTEAAFGINEYLRHANDSGSGVVTMGPLFASTRR